MTATISFFKSSTDAEPHRAGDVIFREGDAAHDFYVVTEGEVALTIGGEVVDVVGPGGMFGELALIDPAPRSATATAKTDAKVVPVNEKRFFFLIQQTPGFALQVMRAMADRLKRNDAKR
jgi:CRP-like cAMP-binding protein